MTEAHDADEALDVYGAREAVLALGRRVQAVRSGRAEGDALLAPPLSRRDHLDGPQWAPAVAFALAAEAAATEARFWAMTRALLKIRHDDAIDLQHAARRAGVDFDRLLHLMRAGTGAERVVADVQSALASGVTSAPALFVNGERYRGALHPAAVWSACTAVARN